MTEFELNIVNTCKHGITHLDNENSDSKHVSDKDNVILKLVKSN